MKSYPVSEENEAELTRRMRALKIRESDLEEQFIRSGGHGGQNVNKTSTCVQLTHRPTGTQVKCQTTRQQGLNRFMARLRLLDKLEAIHKEKAAEAKAQREKVKRQKRKRSPAAKEKILKEKARQSEKKQRRKRIDFPE